MSFQDEYDAHEKSSGKSDFFKFKEGDNWLRIMSDPAKKESRWGHGLCFDGAPYCNPQKMQEEYQAKLQEAQVKGTDPKKVSMPKTSVKWSVWAIDRASGAFVIVDLPGGVASDIRKFMDSKEYTFKGFPMPYDINVIADKNVGTINVKYKVLPARANTDITEAEKAELDKQQPIAAVIERMKSKAKREFENGGVDPMNEPIEYPDEEINPADIPF